MATRRERVVLDLEDNLTAGLARAAVAARGLDAALNDLDGNATRAGTALERPARSADQLDGNSQRAGSSINQLTGRLRLLTDVALILGPALGPLGAASIGGIVA